MKAFYSVVSILVVFQLDAGGARAVQCNSSIIPTTPTSRFVFHNDGTVTDSHTGLMWKQCVEGLSGWSCATGTASNMNWKDALEHARSHSFSGFGDWRVPNIKQLASILELSCDSPTINLAVFPNTPSSAIWSSSPYADTSYDAWKLDFSSGFDENYSKNVPHQVRLVRDGQLGVCSLPGGAKDTMLRDTAAEWLSKCVYGATHISPAYTGVYTDVADGDYNDDWIEQVYNDGITKGCNSTNTLYCPKDPVDKIQAVKLILRAEHGSRYTPPVAGVAPYTDVLLSHPDIDWINQAKIEGITTGCGDGGNFCPNAVLSQKGFQKMLDGAF